MATAKPFLFLFTGDEFLRRNKIEALVAQTLPETVRTTNLLKIYPDELDLENILSQASTASLLGDAQIFWITQVDRLKKTDWSVLETYCKKPSPDSIFIFEADELPETNALSKLVGRFGKRTDIGAANRDGSIEALRAKLRRFGKKLTPDAMQILEERLGGSTRLMDIALDQLIVYAEGDTIDGKAVQGLSSEFLKYEPFDLTEALANQDPAEAIRIFHFFYDLSGDITSAVGLLHWQLKRIWQAKRILAEGGSREDVGRAVRVPPYRLGPFLLQVKKFKETTVEELLKRLWRIDWDTKTGALDDALAMEVFLASAS